MTDWHPPLKTPGGTGDRAARRRAAKQAAKSYPKTYEDAFVPSTFGPVYLPPFTALTPAGVEQCYLVNFRERPTATTARVVTERRKHLALINRNLKELVGD